MGFYSWNLAIIGIVWGLVESILAAAAGAYFYKDEFASRRRRISGR